VCTKEFDVAGMEGYLTKCFEFQGCSHGTLSAKPCRGFVE
jgi:hypothetical protein